MTRPQTIYRWGSWFTMDPADADPWFHDVLHADGTPYDTEEADLTGQLTGRWHRGPRTGRSALRELASPKLAIHHEPVLVLAPIGTSMARGGTTYRGCGTGSNARKYAPEMNRR